MYLLHDWRYNYPVSSSLCGRPADLFEQQEQEEFEEATNDIQDEALVNKAFEVGLTTEDRSRAVHQGIDSEQLTAALLPHQRIQDRS